jgi:hypothetical protein
LDHLTKTVAKESWRLIEDLEESPYSALRHSVKDDRASA